MTVPGFNGSGTYVRAYNWQDDAANGIPITASRFDTEDDGYATAGLSQVICKDGQTTTTAMIPFAAGLSASNGTAAAPSITFTADTNSGLYRIGADNVGLALNGIKQIDYATTAITYTPPLAIAGASALSSTQINLGIGFVPISSVTASSSATVDFTSGIDATYDAYLFVLDNILPATDGAVMQGRVFVSGSPVTANYDWITRELTTASPGTLNASAAAANNRILFVGSSQGNASGEGASGMMWMINPASASVPTRMHMELNVMNSAGTALFCSHETDASYQVAAAVDGFRFYMDSGNIASGTVSMFGVRFA